METVVCFNAKREKGVRMEPIDTQLFGVVHTAKRINSKVKGNRNELEVSKLFTNWTGHEFVRVPMSGGIRWKQRTDVCGDIINNDPAFHFPFSVEAKSYRRLGIPAINHALRKNSIIYTFFAQCEKDAKDVNKIPFLIARENGMPKDLHYIFLKLDLGQTMKMSNYIHPNYTGDEDLVGFNSKEFFEKVSVETLKFIYE
jgi:hypothetical protein